MVSGGIGYGSFIRDLLVIRTSEVFLLFLAYANNQYVLLRQMEVVAQSHLISDLADSLASQAQNDQPLPLIKRLVDLAVQTTLQTTPRWSVHFYLTWLDQQPGD